MYLSMSICQLKSFIVSNKNYLQQMYFKNELSTGKPAVLIIPKSKDTASY